MKGKIIAVSVSDTKGCRKQSVPSVRFLENHGIEGDAHAGDWHRQVSLLAVESVEKIRDTGLEVGPGDFAENLTTQGIDLPALRIGDRLRLGRSIELEVTQIGKECRDRCSIYQQVGDCVMPREGIFARVVRGGLLNAGDSIELVRADETG